MGNVNEHGLAIGETTFGGLGILDGNGGVGLLDYGSLIWLTLQVGSVVWRPPFCGGSKHQTRALQSLVRQLRRLSHLRLQRAKTAREAIATMSSLTTDFGYASDGESFAIADGNEAWLMEIVGKGKEEKGVPMPREHDPRSWYTAYNITVCCRASYTALASRCRSSVGGDASPGRVHHRHCQPGKLTQPRCAVPPCEWWHTLWPRHR